MRNIIITIGLIVPLSLAFNFCAKENNPNPNILILLADDMGYGEPGCYGQEVIKTPFIDSLAIAGMLFTDFYAGSSVCSPSRAVLMTGRHAGNTSVRGNVGLYPDGSWYRVPLASDETTLGEMLKSAGYQTAFIGKWHLENPDSLKTWAYHRGFDYVVQEQWPERSRPGARQFDAPDHWINGWTKSIRYDQEKYDCIDEFRTNLALEYLDQKKKDQPFFLFMSYRIPHGHERYTRNKTLYGEYEWDEAERRHAARITMLDREIRRLLDRIVSDGELDNTVVIFTSDNGPTNEGHDYDFFNSNGNLRGFKRDLYEGGIRVPMIVFWPGKIKAGTVSNHPSGFYDIMPTLAEIAGISKPADTDGISFLPELMGKEQKKHEFLYWEITERALSSHSQGDGFRQAVRFGDWKAVRKGGEGHIEIYNLEQDIGEKNNLASSKPELVKKAENYFNEARTENPFFPFGGYSFFRETRNQ
jgi:arylsulfatase A-like enzyme